MHLVVFPEPSPGWGIREMDWQVAQAHVAITG